MRPELVVGPVRGRCSGRSRLRELPCSIFHQTKRSACDTSLFPGVDYLGGTRLGVHRQSRFNYVSVCVLPV